MAPTGFLSFILAATAAIFSSSPAIVQAAPFGGTITLTRTEIPSCTLSVCVDYLNECNMMYGTCFLAPECGGTWPTMTPPACPSGWNETSTVPASTTTVEITSSSSTLSDMGTTTCITWPPGGGGETPSPSPSTSVPITITPTPEPSTTNTAGCSVTMCADYTNSCGKPYGGCFLAPHCGGTWPEFTPPPCP